MRTYITMLLLTSFLYCHAQQQVDSTATINQEKSIRNKNPDRWDLKSTTLNVVKINLPSLLINNYSVSFERLIARKISIQIGYRYQPYKYLMENVLGRKLTKSGSAIDFRYYNFQTSNNALTADFRIYTGKKSGLQGLYFGLYGRYAFFDADNLEYNYIDKDDIEYEVPLVSNFRGMGGGLILGRQWLIKKRITIDYFIGAQYGKISGSLISNKDLTGLTAQQKNDLKDNIGELYILLNKNYISNLTVSDIGVNGKIAGPFIGIRSGISIGVAF